MLVVCHGDAMPFNGVPVSRDLAAAFLGAHLGVADADVTDLGGGDWSRAFAVSRREGELVARFGRFREDFDTDAMAMAFAGPHLPVPHVYEVIPAFDGFCALSDRHYGEFVETLAEPELVTVLPALWAALDAMRSLPVPPATSDTDWHDWLVGAIRDEPGARVSGWRRTLAASPDLDQLFIGGCDEFRGLLKWCPPDRHVVHGDLINRNVLADPYAGVLTAVFDWGCLTYGDFLYDVAWLEFWAPWHPGLATLSIAERAEQHLFDVGVRVPHFDQRLRAYAIHIGLCHLAYLTFVHDERELAAVAARLRRYLAT